MEIKIVETELLRKKETKKGLDISILIGKSWNSIGENGGLTFEEAEQLCRAIASKLTLKVSK